MKEKRSSALRVVLALAAGFCLGLVLVACGTSNDNSTANSNASGNTSSNTTRSTTTTTTTSNTPATSASPATTTASTSGGVTGVPVCDEYIEKYEKCVNDKVPEAARAQLRSSLETSRKAWKEAASTPQGKANLAPICQTALNTAKQTMSAYGCTW